jgi:hypothetical protein
MFAPRLVGVALPLTAVQWRAYANAAGWGRDEPLRHVLAVSECQADR